MTGCAESSPNYEAQFVHRFTGQDEEFQRYLQKASSQPPVVEAWRPRGGFQRGRDHRFGNGRQQGCQESDRGRDYGRSRGWSNDSRSAHGWQERRWSSGRVEQNTYNWRPHYDR